MSLFLSELEKKLGYKFSSANLLKLALTHSSMAKTRSNREMTNQRLEFLGDRVLGLIIAEMIYENFPYEEEGAMARRHTALVRMETLARVAIKLDFEEYLILATAEKGGGSQKNPALLADACEAVIAAMFLDGGLIAAETFIRNHWTKLMEEDLTPPKDAKTALQEYAQSLGKNLPCYREISRDGPPHDPIFTIEVLIEDEEPVIGRGRSKRHAEQFAASELITRLGIGELKAN